MSVKKDIKKLIRELEKRGWKRIKAGKHIKLEYINGRKIVLSSSPSCIYAAENIRADADRIEWEHRG